MVVQGETDWPFAPNILLQAVEQIPSRMHFRAAPDTDVTLIPKAVWERQQRGELEHAPEEGVYTANTPFATNESTQWLLNRKRKSAGRERGTPLRSRQQRQRQQSVNDIPRPASQDEGTLHFSLADISTNWTEQQKRELDWYVHAPDRSLTYPVLLGALSDLKRFHQWKQDAIDQQGKKKGVGSGNGSDRKRMRAQRNFVNERLGDHQEEAADYEAGRRKRVSRIMRTSTENGVGGFNLDMTDALLEWKYPATGKGRCWYAFSNLEVILLEADQQELELPPAEE